MTGSLGFLFKKNKERKDREWIRPGSQLEIANRNRLFIAPLTLQSLCVCVFFFFDFFPFFVFGYSLLFLCVFLTDLLTGRFGGAVFPLCRSARKQPVSLNGAFPLLIGPFSDLNGPFA